MKILVVDDNLKDANRLSLHLSNEDAQVEVCTSGIDADAILAERGLEFSIAYISWDMAGAHNGQQLIAKYRKALPNLKITVMSRDRGDTIHTFAARLGANDFLKKPLAVNDVLANIESINNSILIDREEIERLKIKKQKSLHALSKVLEQI